MKKQVLSALLTLVMVFTLLPVSALAGEKAVETTPNGQWENTVTSVPTGYSADDDKKTVSISSAEGMVWFAKQIKNNNTYEGYTITLENDVDLGAHYWISWDNSGAFSGCFDGNGHTIRNLYITGSMHGQGLFPAIRYGGVIKNLHVENAHITSSVPTMDTSGIIAYKLVNGTITNCHVSNSSITQRSGAGMIVGATIANEGGVISYCSVKNCDLTLSATANIRGGGIAGELRPGNIYSNCLVDGLSVDLSLTAPNKEFNIGGIAGFNLGGTVEQCCVRNISVAYSGESPVLNIGTVVGAFNSGSVSMCYAEKNDAFSYTGTNSSNADVSELTDEQFSEESNFPYLDFDEVWVVDSELGLRLQNSYSFPVLFYAEKLKITNGETGAVIGGYDGTGGSVAALISVDIPLDCNSVTITASPSSGASVNGVPATVTFPESTDTEVLRHTFTVEYAGETSKEVTVVLTRPSKLAGTGTEGDPLIVSCLEDLKNLSKNITQRNIQSANVSITSDIDCGGTAIQPVSSVKNVNGNGHAISNFTINDTHTGATGLFQTLASAGRISDLYIDSATISGGPGSGILVGTVESGATVTDCAVTGSSFTGNIGHYSGLLFGTNKGTVSNCYCEGDTRNAAPNILSGAMGGTNQGTVTSCYSNVFVTGKNSGTDKGAFIRDNKDGSIANCFWNAERIKNCFSAGPASHSTRMGTVTESAGVKFSVEAPLQFGDTKEIVITYSAQDTAYYPTELTGFDFTGDSCASVSGTNNDVSVTGQNVGTSTISASVKIGEKSWPFQTFEIDVSAKPISIAMTNQSVEYDGTAQTIEVAANGNETLPGDLTLVYSYKESDAEDSTYTHTPPTAPGTYTVKVENENPNYTLTGTTTATLTISAPPDETDVSENVIVTAPSSLVYDGSEKSYTAAYEGISEWSIDYYDSDGVKLDSAPVNAGDYTVTINGNSESAYASITTEFTITPAELTVTADNKSIYVGDTLPEYSYTVTGWQGEDEGTTIEGVFATCEDAKADTAGDYTITVAGPETIDNYTIKYADGTLTVSRRSSGGSSSTTTTTEKNEDGSTTTTVTDKKTGTVTETTKFKDGSTLAVETKKDGAVTTTETRVDKVVVKTVDAPGKDVTAAVTLPSGVKTATVNLPAQVTPGTVAVDVKTGEIVKLSVPTEGGMLVKLDGSAELVLEDRSRDFYDVTGHWAEDSIDFATAHEMFNGTGEATFAPDGAMTRAMLMTVLARFDGHNTEGGATWYEKGMEWAVASGVSDGTNPDVAITREQLAAMLYRYAGSPAGTGDLSHFVDADKASGYAADAMVWAVSNGIIAGMGNSTLAPQGSATRAQVAAVLMRFCAYLTR